MLPRKFDGARRRRDARLARLGHVVMEMSHRGKDSSPSTRTRARLRELLAVPETQDPSSSGRGHAAVRADPHAPAARQAKADYVVTGEWSKKAVKEAKSYCDVAIAAFGGQELHLRTEEFFGKKRPRVRHYCRTRHRRRRIPFNSRIEKRHSARRHASSHFLSRPLRSRNSADLRRRAEESPPGRVDV